MRNLNLWVVMTFVALILSGCLFPEPPNPQMFRNQTVIGDNIPVYHYRGTPHGRNLVFLAADTFLQDEFSDALTHLYGQQNPPRLEEITWWRFAPYFQELYDQVIHIPWDKARYEHVTAALEYAQSLGQPFDVILLTHGLPGRLSDGDHGYFLSWKELAKYHGKLSNLHMVFLQSCYGSSLAQDWFKTGARWVISYPDLNRNFLYVDMFLRWYRWHDFEPDVAYQSAISSFPQALSTETLYTTLLEQAEVTPAQYLEVSPYPELHKNAPLILQPPSDW